MCTPANFIRYLPAIAVYCVTLRIMFEVCFMSLIQTLELLAGKLELPQPAKEQQVVPAAPASAVESSAAEQQQQQDGSEARGAAPAAAAADVTAGVVLRQRWFFTGPGHPLHYVEDGLRNGCKCQVSQHTHRRQ